jgi:hypothetical protein
MAKPPKLAKPPKDGVRYLYTPVYLRRHDEDAFTVCVISLDNCGHKLLAEHDHVQLRFRFPVDQEGGCPQCGTPIQGHFRWEFYTEGALDTGALDAMMGVQDEGGRSSSQTPTTPKRTP